MHAHSWDLRSELPESFGDDAARDAFVQRILTGWRAAPLSELDRALCDYAAELTHQPGAMTEARVDALRAMGLDDATIHDAIQVIAYFNYINRVADAVHVELEPEMPPYPEG